MLPGRYKKGIIISKIPLIQAGLKGVMSSHFPNYDLKICHSVEELTLLQLRCANVVIADITGDQERPRALCEQYDNLISQYRDIHWVFIVSRSYYPQAVEQLKTVGCTLLSDAEPIEKLVDILHSGNNGSAPGDNSPLSPGDSGAANVDNRSIILTISERKVLRLLGKGWGINQIAMLLKKSNKTISAQKNSAMRRLSIHSNAEMYAWINSSQGARELNLPSVYGDATEWKKEPPREMSHS
ncbi:LuxR C-terminal-related transcriptional regulator [Intestinirhabdus alba]|uniref:DNA-binding response regulator n=1 Tax=Intestinirhabdus alba TaxID=2899544 RepID=A0A6L6IIT2_9ENTR|nr:LuxR C-terminal-related transcriptional regulator [Intestinirhabdus alba]MTH45000.1 DNA-binding response regulator [Intestinirhabdus alba]